MIHEDPRGYLAGPSAQSGHQRRLLEHDLRDEYAESEGLEEPDPRVLFALLLAAGLYRVGEQV